MTESVNLCVMLRVAMQHLDKSESKYIRVRGSALKQKIINTRYHSVKFGYFRTGASRDKKQKYIGDWC